MTVDHFTRANEGTYTVQIHDGKAKAQSSLVLVGDGELFFSPWNSTNTHIHVKQHRHKHFIHTHSVLPVFSFQGCAEGG